tara:strand:- start:646 stop:1320 length:675 start_codon:yes stop_codon:yes gene_type:complete
MHQRISKKIIIYLFLFFLFATINNKFLDNASFPNINSIKITGVNDKEYEKIQKDMSHLTYNNIFFLDELSIKQSIYSNESIEKLSIFKNYPSKLEIKIDKTEFLAITKKNGVSYFIGSNGKMIKTESTDLNLPFVFGNINNKEFLRFRSLINSSEFDYHNIKNLYFYLSNRWDIETRQGLIIKLPKDDLKQALNILTILLKKDEFQYKKIIDLRQKNQVVVNEK